MHMNEKKKKLIIQKKPSELLNDYNIHLVSTVVNVTFLHIRIHEL